VVDHLLVFKGNGIIRDFPGNYSQYREMGDGYWMRDESSTRKKAKEKESRKERRLSARWSIWCSTCAPRPRLPRTGLPATKFAMS
jgi:hypothetical protein